MTGSPSLEELRAAFAEPGDAHDPASCPAAAEIWDGVHGALPSGRLREVVDHLAECRACAESWRIALQFERAGEAAEREDDEAPEARRAAAAPGWARWPQRRRLYGGAAAAAAVALAAVLVTHQLGDGAARTGSTLRGGGVAVDPRAPHWVTPSGSVLPRRNGQLRWAGPPGTLYDLKVETGEAEARVTVAAAHGLSASSYPLPALRAGAGLRAALTAHLPDGSATILVGEFRIE